MPRHVAETRHQRDEEMRLKKHIETVVPLVPVREIPGLAPEERVAELRLRVRSGVYARAGVMDQVARSMLDSRAP
jgi:hypothetical protein